MYLSPNHKSLYDQNFLGFTISFLVFFFASKALGLTPGYALDDYATLSSLNVHMQAFLLSQGRFTFAILQSAMDASDLKQPELAGVGFFLSAAGLIFIFWFTLSRWLQKNIALAISLGAFLGAHSFFSEYVSFRQSLFPMGICFLLTAAAIKILTKNTHIRIISVLASATLAALASGINQLAMAFYCIASLGVFLQKDITAPPIQSTITAIKKTALIGLLASILYLIFFTTTIALLNIGNNSRMSLLDPSNFSTRAIEISSLLENIFSGNHQLIGKITAACTAIAVMVLFIRKTTKKEAWSHVLSGGIVLILSTFIAILPTSISVTWWPMPRTLIAIPIAIAIGIAILSNNASKTQIHISIVALLISSIILSGKSNALLLDQQRLNRWDIFLARDIINKASEKTQITESTPIFIHRAKWAHDVDKQMPIGDANTSALSIDWAISALFEEATGRKLNVSKGLEGDISCEKKPPFPNPDSIHEENGSVHICL